jgi:polysaccharide pyruvyl transferase WcaK-like protein
MTRILLLNYSDRIERIDNWGSQIMLHALQRLLGDHVPDLTLSWITGAWLVRQYRQLKFGPRTLFRSDLRLPPLTYSLSRRLSRVVDFYPAVADDFERVAESWMMGAGGPQAREFLAAARGADIVVHNGEHQMYRNSREGCRALFLLWLARTRLHKPSAEINHTANLTSVQPIMPGMVQLAYSVLDVVTVREPASLDNLAALGVRNAQLVPDPVFYLEPERYPTDSVATWKRAAGLERGPYFCLSASALPMSIPMDTSAGAVVELVTRLKRVIPQAVLVAKDRSCRFLADVAARTNSLYFGPEHSFADLWPLFRDATLLVSGHYHYVIMAAMVGCPFVPLSTTTHKMEGLCRLLDWHITRPYDATFLRAQADRLVAEAERLTLDRPHHAEHLVRRTAALRHDAIRNAVVLSEAVGAARP